MISTASDCNRAFLKFPDNENCSEVLRNERTFLKNELEFLNATHFKILAEDGDYIKEEHLAAFEELVKFRATKEDAVFELKIPLKLILLANYPRAESYKLYGATWIGDHYQSHFVSFLKKNQRFFNYLIY